MSQNDSPARWARFMLDGQELLGRVIEQDSDTGVLTIRVATEVDRVPNLFETSTLIDTTWTVDGRVVRLPASAVLKVYRPRPRWHWE